MNAREVVYYVTSRLVGELVESRFFRGFFDLFTYPVDNGCVIKESISAWLKAYGVGLAGAAVLIFLITNGIWSAIDGRFLVADSVELYNFLEDWPNIINYAFIVPVYVVFGGCFLFHIQHLNSASGFPELAKELGINNKASYKLPRIILAALVIAFTCFGLIFVYASELSRHGSLFWFQELGPNGSMRLSGLGYYYLSVNAVLNLFIVAIIACHFIFFSNAVKIGRELRKIELGKKPTPEAILDKFGVMKLFEPFSSLYMLSKVLALAGLANLYTWKAQQQDFVGLLDFSILIYALIGVAFISFPRYHLQYRLARVWWKEGIYEYPDVRYPLVRGLANSADILIIGAATTNLMVYLLLKLGIYT